MPCVQVDKAGFCVSKEVVLITQIDFRVLVVVQEKVVVEVLEINT